MKISLLIISSFFLFVLSAHAQPPVETLKKWSSAAPIEKAYLHTDREYYLAGETLWFKAYLYSDYYPDTISTNLHVELLDESSKLVNAKVCPVLFAVARGQVELPDSLPTGSYILRAYSPTMLNNGEDFVFLKKIQLTGKKQSAAKLPVKTAERKVVFFPESGNFVAAVNNNIAFKVTDNLGMPLEVSGALKNNKDELIDSFVSYHNGMGSFSFTPAENESYYVQLDNDAAAVRYNLPPVVKSGVVLLLQSGTKGKNFEIHNHSANEAMAPAYMIGQMQHHLSFKIDIDPKKKKVSGFINTEQLSSGILHVTVFNKDNMPLAERLSFVLNNDYIQSAELIADTLDTGEKAKNKFTIVLPKDVAGSFSVAVTDADYGEEGYRESNIISSILLTTDLRGYIHKPAWYFSAQTNKDSALKALDFLMLTHGWRRFQWSTINDIANKPLRYKDPGYITVSGTVNARDRKKPLTNTSLMYLLFPQDTLRSPRMDFITTDALGKFKLDSLLFFGKTRFLISDFNKKNKKWLDVYPDSDSLPVSLSLGIAGNYYKVPPAFFTNSLASRMNADFDSYLHEKGKVLEGVTVKAKLKSPLEALEDRYVRSGLFSGMATRTIDLVNTDEAIHQLNIFDYIQGRVPGVRVERDGIDYSIFYRQSTSLTQGQAPMVIYLDEIETDPSVVSTIPADQIAMIKVYSTFVGASGNGAGGVLAIYTKKGDDITSRAGTSADIFEYKGYSILKEFYSPDYTTEAALLQARLKPDNRITLDWQPDIFTNGVATKIPVLFYNNDRTKRFKVVAEGVTTDGKLLMIEKVIAPKAF